MRRIRGGYDAPHQRGGLETRKIDQNLTSPKMVQKCTKNCSMRPNFEFLAISRQFFTFFGPFWGHFGVILRRNLLSRQSPKSCSNGPLGPNGQKLKIWPMEQCIVHFGRQILVDLAGLQTLPLMRGTRPPSDAGHWIPPLMRRIRPPSGRPHILPKSARGFRDTL